MNENTITVRIDDIEPGDAVCALLAFKGVYSSMMAKLDKDVENIINSLVDSVNASEPIDACYSLPYGETFDVNISVYKHTGAGKYDISIEVPADVFRFYCGYASACRNKIVRKEEERKKARQVKRTKRDKK